MFVWDRMECSQQDIGLFGESWRNKIGFEFGPENVGYGILLMVLGKKMIQHQV